MLARYRNAETGELIDDLASFQGKYVIERPCGEDVYGDVIWPDEASVLLKCQYTQEEAKNFLKYIQNTDNPYLQDIKKSLERQIWKFNKECNNAKTAYGRRNGI